MDRIKLLYQLNFSISFIIHREKKLTEHRDKLESVIGKPFYITLEDGIEQIEKQIRDEKELLKLYLKDYQMYLNS